VQMSLLDVTFDQFLSGDFKYGSGGRVFPFVIWEVLLKWVCASCWRHQWWKVSSSWSCCCVRVLVSEP